MNSLELMRGGMWHHGIVPEIGVPLAETDPITALSPIVTPGNTTTFPPSHTLLPIVTGRERITWN